MPIASRKSHLFQGSLPASTPQLPRFLDFKIEVDSAGLRNATCVLFLFKLELWVTLGILDHQGPIYREIVDLCRSLSLRKLRPSHITTSCPSGLSKYKQNSNTHSELNVRSRSDGQTWRSRPMLETPGTIREVNDRVDTEISSNSKLW